MQSVSFSIRRVNRLRRAAERARLIPDGAADASGWFASAYDATHLIRVFDTLRLKAGFALQAYVYQAGSNGNGLIWAVPADAPLVVPGDCPRLDDTWLEPPRPPGAVRLMQAIEGDGSPWSYLSASILCREAAEFGAIWHGCIWSGKARGTRPRLSTTFDRWAELSPTVQPLWNRQALRHSAVCCGRIFRGPATPLQIQTVFSRHVSH